MSFPSSLGPASAVASHPRCSTERYIPLEQLHPKTSQNGYLTIEEGLATTISRPRHDSVTGEDVDGDKDRLRKLGYDPVLGRPLGFWSNMLLTLTNMSPVYDIVASITVWSHNGPLLFIIGYPCIAVLHLVMLGPFAELSSTFPVAGAHATWSWKCARAGTRGERYWGWLMNGFVLAAHLAKVLAGLWHTVAVCVSIFIEMTHVQVNPMTRQPLRREVWWEPVFNILIVSVVAVIVVSRLARTSTFWICAGVSNILMTVVLLGFCIAAASKVSHAHQSLGFPNRSQWTLGFSYMIFLGLPLKLTAFDAGAHMAEETRNPAKTVPRSLFTAALIHFTLVYVTVVTFIFALTPLTGPIVTTSGSLLIPIMMELSFSIEWLYTIAILIICISCTQLVSGVVVCSRFLFAVARDQGIPFSRYLRKTFNGEPWVADLSLLVVSYLSLTAWFYQTSTNNYYLLLNAISYWVPCIPYLIVMFLYATSRLDLQHEQRTQFTLRQWSKPMAVVACLWMLLSIIQGCFPTSLWTVFDAGEGSLGEPSFFPFAVIGMLFVMAISWFLYGRRHYIGPIRSMTKWSAGVEINPNDPQGMVRRPNVVKEYMGSDMRLNTPSPRSASSPLKVLFKKTNSNSVRATLVGSNQIKESNSRSQQEAAQTESQLLPSRRHSWYQRHRNQRPNAPRLGGIAEVSNASTDPMPLPARATHSYAQEESGVLPQAETQFSVAQQESGIWPLESHCSVARSREVSSPQDVAQQESGVFPFQAPDATTTHMSVAQGESQILPNDDIFEYHLPAPERLGGYPAPPPRTRN